MTDARILQTKKALQNAITALAEQKEISDITVTELCKKAEINRSTFYQYYQVPGDIVTEMLQEMFDHTIHQFYHVPADKKKMEYVVARLTSCYEWYYEHRDIFSIMNLWVENGCQQSPQEMAQYTARQIQKIRG